MKANNKFQVYNDIFLRHSFWNRFLKTRKLSHKQQHSALSRLLYLPIFVNRGCEAKQYIAWRRCQDVFVILTTSVSKWWRTSSFINLTRRHQSNHVQQNKSSDICHPGGHWTRCVPVRGCTGVIAKENRLLGNTGYAKHNKGSIVLFS